MASESTSLQQSQQPPPSSKVKFRCEEGIITFNNVVALLEQPNESFGIQQRLKKRPRPSPSYFHGGDKPMSFTQDEFISAISLPICKDDVPLPPNETYLIPPSGEVNADDTADKSLSKAYVQPVTQPTAPTDLKHTEVTVAIVDATKSLVASELAEEQVNQPSAAKAEKVLDQNVEEDVKDVGFVVMEEVTFEQIMDKVDSKTQGAQEIVESSYDTESEIKIIKSYQAATIFGLLFIYQSSSYDQEDQEEIDITPKDAKE
ncbi:hypothetical protein Tco_0232097 [Tanacetum coccineum]